MSLHYQLKTSILQCACLFAERGIIKYIHLVSRKEEEAMKKHAHDE